MSHTNVLISFLSSNFSIYLENLYTNLSLSPKQQALWTVQLQFYASIWIFPIYFSYIDIYTVFFLIYWIYHDILEDLLISVKTFIKNKHKLVSFYLAYVGYKLYWVILLIRTHFNVSTQKYTCIYKHTIGLKSNRSI